MFGHINMKQFVIKIYSKTLLYSVIEWCDLIRIRLNSIWTIPDNYYILIIVCNPFSRCYI